MVTPEEKSFGEASPAVDPTSFLIEKGPEQPLKGSFEIRDIDGIWDLIRTGTTKYTTHRSGFVRLGPELGNLGGSPAVRFIDDHITVKMDIHKEGAGSFYKIIPEAAIQAKMREVSPNLAVNGVNVYLVSQEGRERVAYKNSTGEFIYDPAERVVINPEELRKHLELASGIYLAYSKAYYEESGLPFPADTLIFDGKFLMMDEASYQSSKTSANTAEELPEGIVVSDKPEETFKDIGGQEKAVAVCRRFAEQLRYPEVFALQGSVPPRGILLSGPPGTGKTLLAKAIANEADSHFLHIDASDIAGQGLYGQSERAVKGIFALARKLSASDGRHAVIFVDEGDLLLPRSGIDGGHRHEATGKTISIFAQEMDGLASSRKITVIISTNDPQSLDSRILSRMEESEEVAMPGKEGLNQILRIHLTKFNQKADREIFGPDINLDILSEKAYRQGLSGRDIADVVALVSRQRGQRQLALIEEAIKQGQLQIPSGENERVYINRIAGRIARQEIGGVEELVLAPATTGEISEIIDHAKVLLKNKPDRRIGFIRN